MHSTTPTATPAVTRTLNTTERALVLPFSGQQLRQAVSNHDIAGLMDCAQQLRVAGYRVLPQHLVSELLTHGCTWLVDPFGQRVALQVQVPARHRPAEAPDPSVAFRISA